MFESFEFDLRNASFDWDDDKDKIKEIPHNMGGSLAGEFQPSAACKFLDLPPVSLRNLQATAD